MTKSTCFKCFAGGFMFLFSSLYQ